MSYLISVPGGDKRLRNTTADININIFGYLYSGVETIRERGFAIGDIVHVGADYSFKKGEIVGFSNNDPHKAKIKSITPDSKFTIECYIKSEHLCLYVPTDDN